MVSDSDDSDDGRREGSSVREEPGDQLENAAHLEEDENTDTDSDTDSTTTSSSGSETSKERSNSAIPPPAAPRTYVSCIQEAQLSPDGTCIFTTDYARAFTVYPIDSDILSEPSTRPLRPYARLSSTDPIWAFAANPAFALHDASTTTVLLGRRDQYISLHNALWDVSRPYDAADPPATPVDISTKLAAYPLVDELTEAVLAPSSLAFAHDGASFYAGHQHRISVFDLNHTDGPVSSIRTIPSTRNKRVGGGRGFKGVVTALCISPTADMLAAGARSRHLGLYDPASATEITHFALPGALLRGTQRTADPELQAIMGDGVTQLRFSPCGTYLYVAERCSNTLLIYDVRNYSLALGHCAGRAARTKQRLGFDVWSAGDGHEIWAGGTDGRVRAWRDPWAREGAVEADEVVEVGDGPVSACLVHACGSLAVVARGRYEVGREEGGELKGRMRGGGRMPWFGEWGCLDIFGLGS